MSEETPDKSGQEEWEAPPLPEEIPVPEKEEPQMSEVSTITKYFFRTR